MESGRVTGFALHPRLAADTAPVADLALSRLLLMNDRRFAWAILVPRIAGLRELHALDEADAGRLNGEIRALSRLMHARERADKMNVAALGNMVPQLHIHVIARHEGDAAWPQPVWCAGAPEPMERAALEARATALAAALAERHPDMVETDAR